MRATRSRLNEMVLYGLLFLVFFQLLTDFVAAIYAFGLLQTSLTVEIVAVVLLFSPVLLLFLPEHLPPRFFFWLGLLVLFCRAVEVLLDTRGRMLVAGVGSAGFLVFFPALLGRPASRAQASRLAAGLAFGTALAILVRALGSGVDITTYGSLRLVGWGLAVLAAILLTRQFYKPVRQSDHEIADGQPSYSMNKGVYGLSLGLMSVFILLYFAFASPNVIARWAGVHFGLVIGLGMLGLLVTFALMMFAPARKHLLTRPAVLVWNGLFILCLELTLLGAQVGFPSGAEGYPLLEPAASPLQLLFISGTLLLWPVMLVDFGLFCREMIQRTPTNRRLGAAFTLGSLFLLVMVFAHVFTTVYDYIPVVGPFFRDRYWLVYFIPGIFLILPFFRMPACETADLPVETGEAGWLAGILAALAVAGVAAALLNTPRIPQQNQPSGRLRVLTFNLQQGYSALGLKALDEQLALVRSVDADLIGLQETDTNRISGSNDDLVRYFADRLDLHSYYGPNPATGSFGIALLSKYPLIDPRTFYLYSTGEQTAVIAAQVPIGGEIYQIFVTHLGNGGPLVQQEGVLNLVRGQEKVILVGDFNFRPDTESYRLTTTELVDSWLIRWPGGDPAQSIDPADRIDHIFLSPDLSIQDARFLVGPESDHPALYTDIAR